MKILTINNLDYYYHGEAILIDINYQFYLGKMYAIIGKGGTDKNALMSLLGGLEPVRHGEIKYFKTNINELNSDMYRAKQVGLILQDNGILKEDTVKTNLQIALKLSDKEINNRVFEQLMSRVGLDNCLLNNKAKQLLKIDQQRLAIACALAKNTSVIIADEPTINLDVESENKIMELLKSIVDKDQKTLIILTHSNYVANNCEVILGLNNGYLNPIKQ